MNTANNKEDDSASMCANCGQEGSDVNNICNKCKTVKYCNAACKKKHRQKHKKRCERYAAELHDEMLFKQPPPAEDCPICLERMPTLVSGSKYYSCCGKEICSGCIHAPVYDNLGNEVDNQKCPFCRTPHHTSKEEIAERYKSRMEAGDPIAIFNRGCDYQDGLNGLPDYTKALELFHRAVDLGYTEACCSIGYCHEFGRGVEVDKKKAMHYYELAAMKGNTFARCNLGVLEEDAGNMKRALKHYMVAIRGGHNDALKMIKELYSDGYAMKEATQKHYSYIKHTWVKLRVIRGIKLRHLVRSIVIISIGFVDWKEVA